jgi:hypothetical protein
VDNDDMGPAAPADPVGSASVPVSDMSPVLSFLSGKNCLNGVSLFMFHGIHISQYKLGSELLNMSS